MRETHIFEKNAIFIVLHSIQVHNICHCLGKLSSTLIKKILAGEGGGGINWESSIKTYTLPYVKHRASGTLYITQGAQPSALWGPRGVG